MNAIISQILTQILGAKRFKWHGMVVAWLVCVAGWIGVALVPSSYESKAVLHIDTASVLRPLLADLAVNTNVMSNVRMMSEVLLSRPQLERVVRETDLDLRADTPAEMDELLTSMRERIQVSGGSPRNVFDEQNVYTIKFVDKDPQTVYVVVQSLLDSFVESSLGQNKAESAGAQKFIQEQIDQYEERLAEAEQELAEFKRKNVGLMPSEGQDYYQRLQTELDDLDGLRAELSTVEARRRELQRQLDGEEPSFGLLTPPDENTGPVSANASSIDAYERELATLLLKYTEKHPKVIELQNRIDQLRNQQAQAASGDQSGPAVNTDLMTGGVLDRNPVYQNLRIAIANTESELSELRGQVSASQSRVNNLREMVDRVPEIEAQLARLNRDYEVNRAQHTALLRRLESARISEEAETQTEDIKFRVIEPPIVPLQPTGPNRTLLASFVLIVGFGLGGGLSFLLNLLNPVFITAENVRQSLQLPVLGSIPAFQSAQTKLAHRRNLRMFAFASAGLVGVYLLVLGSWPAAKTLRQAFQGVVG